MSFSLMRNPELKKVLCARYWISPHLCSFLLHLLARRIAGESQPLYAPDDNIAFDCGSTTIGHVIKDGRTWTTDANSIMSSLLDQANASVTLRSTALESQIPAYELPYSNARLSYSQFTYIFLVTPGPLFIRLHFYFDTYDQGFTSSNAHFSVKANGYVLLRNFSAAAQPRAGSEVYRREFCLYIEDGQNLNLMFIPNPDVADAYTFVNGIEVVSMPDNLYYTIEDDLGTNFIGQYTLRIENTTLLELMYRLNAGGNFIPPEQDTGMFRSWEPDDNYVTFAHPSSFLFNSTIQLKNSRFSPYAAPDLVYKTGRGMGPDRDANERYNLTWEFQVETMFIYLVRLHFCGFISEITNMGDKVFQIYIADQIAEAHADLMSLTGGNGIPAYKDFTVRIEAKEGAKVQNLSIKLHPSPETMTTYSDAILNGVEIFKLSNLKFEQEYPDLSKNHQTKKAPIIEGVVLGIVVLSLLFLLMILLLRANLMHCCEKSLKWRLFFPCLMQSEQGNESSLPQNISCHFLLAEIKAATDNFDSALIIGVGGFGNVYKGFLNRSSTSVAIKRLNPESRQGVHEFKTEIEMLSLLQHDHLVSLLGYCNERGEMILVYDYLSRGTLRDHLYDTDNDPIPWKRRLEMCIGAASGLHCLHTCTPHPIIHRDVKTTNILLDENWVAKVSDFGLSKISVSSSGSAAVSTMVKGTWGYLDPEYARRNQLTKKSDVFSFGVVLFEVLCARKPLNQKLAEEQWNLVDWTGRCIQNGTIHDIIDPYLMGRIAPECFNRFVETAARCVRDQGIERPTMHEVMEKLRLALDLQERADARMQEVNPSCECFYPEISFQVQCSNIGGEDENVASSTKFAPSNTSVSGVTLPR